MYSSDSSTVKCLNQKYAPTNKLVNGCLKPDLNPAPSVSFHPDDLGGRKVFDGTWVSGRREGPGQPGQDLKKGPKKT